MSDSLHVTHAVLTLEVGGLERIVVDLVRQGQRLGQRVSVLCVERPGPLAAQVEALGARVLCTGKPPGLHFSAVGPIKKALLELRPDVLHTHQIAALFYAGPAANAVGVPLTVHTEHGNHLRNAKARFFRRQRMSLLWWWAAKHARRFFCVSQDIATELAARRIVPHGKLAVVLNGINTEPFRESFDKNARRHAAGVPANVPVIGTVGRLNEVKRQDLLLRAFARVRAGHPTARLLLVGDGPSRDSLRKLSVDLGIADAVHFAGYQSQPERFLAMMDAFALTSRLEGLPLALLEAWAAGLPVVASAVGGVPDLLKHGQTGMLFESGDEDRLVEQLKEMLGDSARRRRLGEAGRREVLTKYSLRRMAGDYGRQYCELLGGTVGERTDRPVTENLAESTLAAVNR